MAAPSGLRPAYVRPTWASIRRRDPEEDTTNGSDRGGWFVPYLDETFVGNVKGWAEATDAYLFGGRTYTETAIS